MVTLVAWRGNRQDEGIEGKRVLIVGYSHYCKPDESEDPLLTVRLIDRVIAGDERHAFWASIMHYFGFEDRRNFWSRVGFINYVPGSIGVEDEKFATATAEQIEGAEERLLDVMTAQHSDIAFVFSGKAAWDLKARLSADAPELSRLHLSYAPDVRSDYIFEDMRLTRGERSFHMVLGGHPQGAHRRTMEAMVSQVMA